jgi:hypothetical protein
METPKDSLGIPSGIIDDYAGKVAEHTRTLIYGV